MFKKLSRDAKDLHKSQIELTEIKATVSEMKNIRGEISGRLDIVEERVNELEDVVIQTIK